MSDSQLVVQLVEDVGAGQVEPAHVLLYDQGGEVVLGVVLELRNKPSKGEGGSGRGEEEEEDPEAPDQSHGWAGQSDMAKLSWETERCILKGNKLNISPRLTGPATSDYRPLGIGITLINYHTASLSL